MDSSLRGNDGQVKRVSGIRHIQVETVLVVLSPIEGPAPRLNWRRVSGLRCVGVQVLYGAAPSGFNLFGNLIIEYADRKLILSN